MSTGKLFHNFKPDSFLTLSGLYTVLVVFSMSGKFFIASTFAVIYVYSAELFPTVVRQVGVGSSSMCARIGGLIQPQFGRLVSSSGLIKIRKVLDRSSDQRFFPMVHCRLRSLSLVASNFRIDSLHLPLLSAVNIH